MEEVVTKTDTVRDQVVKLLSDGADETVIDTVIDLARASVLNRYKRYNSTVTELPTSLDYVVTELAIARYNRIGSEGKSSESVEGYSSTYNTKLLDEFDEDIRLVALSDVDADLSRKGKIWYF